VEIIVRGKHFDVPESVEQRAVRKLSKLDHYLPLMQDATVEVDIAHEHAKEPTKRYSVRVLASGRGVHLRSEEHGADIGPALDQAARAIVDQARRHKERLYSRSHGRGAKDFAPPVVVKRDEQLAKIKRFRLKPMSLQDAVSEMDLLGHSFYVYFDADEEQVAVAYRRKAGDVGLILAERL
jgi:putative sigma-54 modulation protein